MKWKKRWVIPIALVVVLGVLSIPEMVHENTGTSVSHGSVRNGKLENGWLVPFRGNNFQYFSRFSYYILNCGYVNDKVYQTITQAYQSCEATCPGSTFRLMECTRKKGGRMLLHWTHQNGTSVDFMVPKKRGQKRNVLSSDFGLFHYLLKFNSSGRLTISPGHKTEIDFETMGRHILALDDAARDNGLRIRKLLFNTHLLDKLFATPAGQEILQRDIFIPKRLNDFVNRFHDDHYHVDFEWIGEER